MQKIFTLVDGLIYEANLLCEKQYYESKYLSSHTILEISIRLFMSNIYLSEDQGIKFE